jgi:hypothetical protein
MWQKTWSRNGGNYKAMSHPRDPYNKLFDRFNACFAEIADQENLTFELWAGPNIGRTLRFRDDPLKRGVFLELKHHWSRSDPADPIVTLAFGAWYRPKPFEFPLHFFSRLSYEGKLSDLQEDAVASKLRLAIADGRRVSQEQVVREGKLFTDLPKNDEEAGSYFQ